MCGFVSYENATIREYPQWTASIDLPETLSLLLDTWPDYQAYPAFGGDINKRVPLLICEEGVYKQVFAIWWFDAFSENEMTFLGKRTSFNARNLDSPFWNSALNNNRALVLATHLGESKLVGKTKHQYLMQSQQAFMLGAVYRKLENGDYCCAIITRDAHPKMTPYHEKAFPLFLPLEHAFLSLWLSEENANNSEIQSLLEAPKLFPTLHVQRVKTYKSKQVIGKISNTLLSDV
jgi:putative SOS response-associated peptidase YedK